MQSKRSWMWIIIIPVGGLLGILILMTMLSFMVPNMEAASSQIVEIELEPSAKANGKIAVIKLGGTIVSAGPQGGLTGHVLRGLKTAKEDPDVAVVLLDIDSPGGSVTDSDLIHHSITALKAEGKHVYAIFGDLCASGGYYIAVAAHEIWSRPTSITGSIGVIVPSFSMAELLTKVGIVDQSVASGANKQILSVTKPMTLEQRDIVQSVVMEMYNRFVRLVAEGRSLDADIVKPLADGRLYSAEQAKKHRLVDEIGYRDDLIKSIRKEHGEDLALVEYRAPISFFDSLAGGHTSPSFDKWFSTRVQLANRPAFLFSPMD